MEYSDTANKAAALTNKCQHYIISRTNIQRFLVNSQICMHIPMLSTKLTCSLIGLLGLRLAPIGLLSTELVGPNPNVYFSNFLAEF